MSDRKLSEVFECRYVFRMPNNDMKPMFQVGERIHVDPKRPLESEKGVVIFKADRSAFLVREFLRSNPVQWVVRKYGDEPIDEEKISRDEWPSAEFISGKDWGWEEATS